MSEGSALLRFSRDRRGYEHFYLIEPASPRHGKSAHVLYWFRTPPGVRVGRPPFDAEMQRAIQEQNPGVGFDWKRILATPMPPPAPDVERWRERRRAERAERAAHRAELTAEEAGEGPGEVPEAEAPDDEAVAAEVPADQPELQKRTGGSAAGPNEAGSRAGAPPPDAASIRQPGRRRRRRRGGRGSRPSGGPAAVSGAVSPESASSQPGDLGASRGGEPGAE